MAFSYKGIDITKYLQSGFRLETESLRIYIDPFRLPNNQSQADYIFLTHQHYDHCDTDSINKILKEKTKIIGNKLVLEKIVKDVEFDEFIETNLGEKIDFGDLHFETLPAYNINSGFHPRKNNGLGYIIHLNDMQIFHMGDTDNIPEFKDVSGIEVAMVPVSGTYVMDVDQAVAATKTILPDVAIPIHYDAGIVGSEKDAQEFASKLHGEVEVVLLETKK